MLALWAAPAAAAAAQLQLGLAAENLVDPADLVGEWFAMVEEKTYPQPVHLRIAKVQPGKTAGKMTFSSPRKCVIDLEYGGPHEGRHIFYIVRFTNCFDYVNSDFVAISRAPEAAGETARAEPAEDDIAAQAEEDGEAAPLDRIAYEITLGGKQREAAIMVRQ